MPPEGVEDWGDGGLPAMVEDDVGDGDELDVGVRDVGCGFDETELAKREDDFAVHLLRIVGCSRLKRFLQVTDRRCLGGVESGPEGRANGNAEAFSSIPRCR